MKVFKNLQGRNKNNSNTHIKLARFEEEVSGVDVFSQSKA
jgi:hypothetical protein